MKKYAKITLCVTLFARSRCIGMFIWLRSRTQATKAEDASSLPGEVRPVVPVYCVRARWRFPRIPGGGPCG